MSKKIEIDDWMNCPECKIKIKHQNLTYHMKHVHNKKINDIEIKSVETLNKKIKEKKTKKFISKKNIAILTIIFIVVAASISIIFLYNYLNLNNQNNNKDYFVSIKGKGNYSSIQDAIDTASNNDTIYVSKGTYFENIKITKPLELIGEDKNTTIINGNEAGTVIQISADYTKISGFTITNSGPLSQNRDAGIKINSNFNTISNCNISSNKCHGLILYGPPKITNNIIKNNIFFNNKYGIYTEDAKTNSISFNIFTKNTDYGIFLLDQSDENTISDNTIIENLYAIRIKGSTLNKVINNHIINNKNGLYFCCGASNNIVYINVFINNTNYNAKDGPINIWDNGKVGNYWADYNGTDSNSDGIGDIPYIINNGIEDRFPLIKPT